MSLLGVVVVAIFVDFMVLRHVYILCFPMGVCLRLSWAMQLLVAELHVILP